MNEQKNTQIVQNAYTAFLRGEIDPLMDLMTEDIEWEFYGPKELPNAGRRRGKPEIRRFFAIVDETYAFDRFEPREFIAQGDSVVALGTYHGTAKPTGRPFEAEFSHVFTLRAGKVARFREYTDTANLVNALAPSLNRV